MPVPAIATFPGDVTPNTHIETYLVTAKTSARTVISHTCADLVAGRFALYSQ